MIFWMRVLAVWTDEIATSSCDSKLDARHKLTLLSVLDIQFLRVLNLQC